MSEPLLAEKAKPHLSLRQLVGRWLPITVWLPAYEWKQNGLQDLFGSLTLGCILIAQSLAHADLCGVHLINGPYSCIVPPLLYAAFGTCIHASVGTGGLVSLLTGEQLKPVGDEETRTRAGAIFTAEVGVILTMMAVLRLSFLVRFLSRPALSGFVTGSALLIIRSQLVPALGMPERIEGVRAIFSNLELANPGTVGISIAAFLFIRYVPKYKKEDVQELQERDQDDSDTRQKKRLKRCFLKVLRPVGEFKELIALILTAAFCSCYAERLHITTVGTVPSGLPHPELPVVTHEDVALAKELLPGAFLVAMVTFLSSFAGAKKFSMIDGYALDATSELLALGLANLGGSFYGAVPVQIGLSRLGISRSVGIQTQLGANVGVAAVISTALLALSPCLFYVPRCVLSCIILNAASHLTEFGEAKKLYRLVPKWSKRKDFAVWLVAFLATIGLGALKGICFAVVVSLVILVYRVAEPPVHILGRVGEKDRWFSTSRTEARTVPGMLVVRVDGPLFYANAESIEETMSQMELDEGDRGNPIRAVVFSASAVTFLDSTGLQVLESMISAHAKRGVPFLIANAIGKALSLIESEVKSMVKKSAASTEVSAATGVSAATWAILQQYMENGLFEDSVSAAVQFLDETLQTEPVVARRSTQNSSVRSMESTPAKNSSMRSIEIVQEPIGEPAEETGHVEGVAKFHPLVKSSRYQSNPSLYRLDKHRRSGLSHRRVSSDMQGVSSDRQPDFSRRVSN
jgi:MFS superfamily sulfate permease-like transporter